MSARIFLCTCDSKNKLSQSTRHTSELPLIEIRVVFVDSLRLVVIQMSRLDVGLVKDALALDPLACLQVHHHVETVVTCLHFIEWNHNGKRIC